MSSIDINVILLFPVWFSIMFLFSILAELKNVLDWCQSTVFRIDRDFSERAKWRLSLLLVDLGGRYTDTALFLWKYQPVSTLRVSLKLGECFLYSISLTTTTAAPQSLIEGGILKNATELGIIYLLKNPLGYGFVP